MYGWEPISIAWSTLLPEVFVLMEAWRLLTSVSVPLTSEMGRNHITSLISEAYGFGPM